MSYDPIDAKVPGPDLQEQPKNIPKSRLFHIAPCVKEKADCTVGNRKKARLENA